MGGRGSNGSMGGNAWKAQINKLAKQGKMPGIVYGDREARKAVMEYIDKVYNMPDTSDIPYYRVFDVGDQVQVQHGNSRSRAFYPSGDQASKAEKRGVLKWLVYGIKQQSK